MSLLLKNLRTLSPAGIDSLVQCLIEKLGLIEFLLKDNNDTLGNLIKAREQVVDAIAGTIAKLSSRTEQLSS